MSRAELHALLDALPEADLPAAERLLRTLRHDPVLQALENAPVDDEADNDDFDGGFSEARAEVAAGQGMTSEELRRRQGLA
ncbi:MAG TPA: hypothetical protein VHR45_19985 [Thermoanaerobaculia bacterium]|nr:hypothetical protein [Thermoanaerobaculia bacterium]